MYRLFVFLIPGILCMTMNYPLGAWFSANNRIGVNLWGAILALTVICIGDFFVLPHAGIMAAPIISSAGYLSYYCYAVYMYRRENPVSWKEFLLIRKSDILKIRQSIVAQKNEFSTENSIIQNSTT